MKELDELTLERAKRGDALAFRELVRIHQGPVHALLGRMLIGVASFAEIEELAQETFVRVHRALPSFEHRGPGRLPKWILTIASNLAIDAMRSRKPRPLPLDEESASGDDSADELARRRRIARALEIAIAALPEDQRAVFLLREYHDFEYEEIAEALRINLGTVRSRLSRARAALRESLAKAGVL